MSFRFFRRKQLFPGVRLNLSRSGPSLSFGARGAHVTVGTRGVTRTVGIPGTGVLFTSRGGRSTGVHSAAKAPSRAALGRKLDDLHRAGLLSDEELAAKKSQLQASDP